MRLVPQKLYFKNLEELKGFVAADPFKDLGTYALLYKITGEIDGPYQLELCGEECRTFQEFYWEVEQIRDAKGIAIIRTLRNRLDLIVEFGREFNSYSTFEDGKDVRGACFDKRTWVAPTAEEIAQAVSEIKKLQADNKKKSGNSKAS